MTVEVDFYLVEDTRPDAILKVASRLAEKAWEQGYAVRALTPDQTMLAALDDCMWTFRQDSFLPHMTAAAAAESAPIPAERLVVLCESEAGLPGGDVLINLSPEFPDTAAQWRRIAEVFAAGEPSRDTARAKYRRYRAEGCVLRHHQL